MDKISLDGRLVCVVDDDAIYRQYLSTILASKKLILIVSGENKRDILERALLEEVNPNIPASYLSLHPHVTVMTDFDL